MNDHLSSSVLNQDYSKPGGSLVLLIEDDRDLAGAIRLDLEAGGHTVHIAETMAEGLRAARSGDVAALIVDRLMDGENGLSIVETLRSEGKWTPALVVSGLTSVDERIAGLKAGCDDYLVKPLMFAN
jgi:two-component system OmpR family response regulator